MVDDDGVDVDGRRKRDFGTAGRRRRFGNERPSRSNQLLVLLHATTTILLLHATTTILLLHTTYM